MNVRTRFAPSPTGFLHIGGARTALFSWLYARRHHGEFILRIEDTDKERSTPEYRQSIVNALRWLGIDWDGEPVLQSARLPYYQRMANELLARQQAYLCYCTPEELDAMRAAQRAKGEKPRYDGRCRDRREPRSGVDPALRLKTPLDGKTGFDDEVKGGLEVNNRELDDMVLLRSDRSPTYNLTSVLDDIAMRISHVIRGDDHLNNTFRQLHIYRALQASPPHFAHLPLIVDKEGKRLAKRSGAAELDQYRRQGYCPEAVINYLLRLGWSHGDQEIFSRAEMLACFDLSSVNASAATVDEKKLLWLNRLHLQKLPEKRLQRAFAAWLKDKNNKHAEELASCLPAMRSRCKTFAEAERLAGNLLNDELFSGRARQALRFLKPENQPALESVAAHAQTLSPWRKDAIQRLLNEVCVAAAIDAKELAPVVRYALCVGLPGPGLSDTVTLLGRERVLLRLRTMIDLLSQAD